VGVVWTRLARRASRAQVARVTTVFLALSFVHLIVDGVHEVAEANVLAGTEGLYLATQPYGSDGLYGQYAPYVLLAVLLLWLLAAIFWGHGKASDGGVTHVDR
jgi:high-affinity iron transporter